ncbi:MAG: methionyl-tRNA formyltransferase, partial [Candidatus Aminicenantes bacterium]|nr:methionyl-tRNA formyltransferase [Candidatus Aminicenantes bacterium]
IKIIQGSPLINLATPAKPGEILGVTKEGIDVSCGDGYRYRLERIKRENRREMKAYEAALGLRIKVGDSFETQTQS